MIIGKVQRQHQPRLKSVSIPTRLHLRPGDSQNSDFRAVNDGCKACTANAAQARYADAAALHLLRLEFPITGARTHLAEFTGEFNNPLGFYVSQDRHHQTVFSIYGHADVKIALEDQIFTIRGQ